MTNLEKDELLKSLLFEEYQAREALNANMVGLQGMVDAIERLTTCIRTLISYTSSHGLSGITRKQATDYRDAHSVVKMDDLKRLADETLQLQDRVVEIQSRKARFRSGEA